MLFGIMERKKCEFVFLMVFCNVSSQKRKYMNQLAFILAFTITGDGILFKIVLALIIMRIMNKREKPHFDPSSGVVTIYETPEETEERHRREAEKKAREMAEESAHVMAEEGRSDAEDKKDEAEMQDADLTDAEQREIELEETELSDAEWQEY